MVWCDVEGEKGRRRGWFMNGWRIEGDRFGMLCVEIHVHSMQLGQNCCIFL